KPAVLGDGACRRLRAQRTKALTGPAELVAAGGAGCARAQQRRQQRIVAGGADGWKVASVLVGVVLGQLPGLADPDGGDGVGAEVIGHALALAALVGA